MDGIVRCFATTCDDHSEVGGTGGRGDTTWRWDAAAAAEVTVTFHETGRDVTWTFGRQLLIDGLAGTSGLGDVQIWRDNDRLKVRLSSPSGCAVYAFKASDVKAFTKATTHLIPAGTEEIDVDAILAGLLAGA
jgi:hypothetical protein